jgi:hypothetical protein
MHKESQATEWPEMDTRRRTWLSFKKAVKHVKYDWMQEAIRQCSLSEMEHDSDASDGEN